MASRPNPFAEPLDDQPRRFTAEERLRVWLKGLPASGLNIAYWRFDIDGNLMSWTDFEDAESVYAWEIDHIVPLAEGGTNDLANLRPLHCSRNRTLTGILDEVALPDPLRPRER
jgi:hypothetical protein